MTIALITPPATSHRTTEENLGLSYLSASLASSGYDNVIKDAWLYGWPVETLVENILSIPDLKLVGISCYISSLNEITDIIVRLKNRLPDLPIICGGYGPTFNPTAFLEAGSDMVLIGEGEEMIVGLARRINSGISYTNPPLPGVIYRGESGSTPCIRNHQVELLDNLPFPSRDTIGRVIELKNPVHVCTSRGCLAHCLFCSVIAFDRTMKQTSAWRQRSISNIVGELKHLHETYGVSSFKFVDDSFIEPPRDAEWAKQFAEAIAKAGITIRFRTQIRTDRLSEELVSALVEAGWFATSVGVENFSATALERMNKSASVEQNLQALHWLEKHGVYVQMGMILFDHETTLGELRENLEQLRVLHWPVTKGVFTEMFAATGTPFTKLITKSGKAKEIKLGNTAYQGREEVQGVYSALKLWQKTHSQIYDEAINPISAPKALPPEGYSNYHAICMEMYEQDLIFFEEVLKQAENSGRMTDIMEYAENQISMQSNYHAGIGQRLNQLNELYGLHDTIHTNKFLV